MVIKCAENDPGSVGYVSAATGEQRAAFDTMAESVGSEPECSTSPSRVYDHVMVDIETMSLHRHKALILSVGMIEFDPTDPDRLHIGGRTLITPDIVDQISLCRRIDLGTQQFWAKQKPAAAEHWKHPEHGLRFDLPGTINVVRMFCAGKTCVWANGTQFDLSNLDGLAEDIGDTTELWHYQAPNDMRTFVRRTRMQREVPIGDALDIPGVAHEPIYDCISQAWQVWSHWQQS